MFDHVTYCLCGTLLLIGHAPPFKLKLYLIPLSEQYSMGVHMMILHSFAGIFQVCEVSAESQVRYELETRFQQLQSRLAAVTLETEEVR